MVYVPDVFPHLPKYDSAIHINRDFRGLIQYALNLRT